MSMEVPYTFNGFDLTAVALDIKTASTTLDVTVTAVAVSAVDPYEVSPFPTGYAFTFSGSAATTGRQTFVLANPARANVMPGYRDLDWTSLSFELTIGGTGAGTVEIGLTASSAQDAGGQSGFSIGDPPSGGMVPRLELLGHVGAVPFLLGGEIISSPEDGIAYRAGERIEAYFYTSRSTGNTGHPSEAVLWLGNSEEHRRVARFAGALWEGYESTRLVYSYTVQNGDADTDGILLGENPLGRNADADFVDSESGIPYDLSLPETQLGTNQAVDGSQLPTCVEIRCLSLSTERLQERGNFFPPPFDTIYVGYFTGFTMNRDAYFDPNPYYGEISSAAFRYVGTEYIIVDLGKFRGFDSSAGNTDITYNIIYITLSSIVSQVAIDRLALDIDGRIYQWSDASLLEGRRLLLWDDEDVIFVDGQTVAVKLIETATATFDAASYTKTEGDSFDVTVTLGDSFANTLTLPVVVTGSGGADAADYSGIPENLVFAPGETVKTFTVTIVDDSRDEEGESLTLSFDDPHIKSGGTNETATVTITDNDPPEVDFGGSSYTVAEGGMQMVTVTLTSAPGSAVTIPITTTDQGSTTPADYSGVPANVMFSTGQTYAFFTFRATQDTEDDDDESVKLTFGTLPSGVQAGTTTEVTFDITDDDDPQVTVSFGAGAYTVPEGGTQAVTVTLSADPERTVVIPLTATDQGSTSPADYSVPLSVTFNTGELSKTITFEAAQDTDDDDDESVLLGFDTSLPAGVSASGTVETTVTITDDDDPQVTVSFEADAYTVPEGGRVTVTVRLSADPERTVVIPLTATDQGSTSPADYSGVPQRVTISAGQMSASFMFEATQDADDDDDESVLLGFDTSLPAGVSASGTVETTVTITDDDDPQVTVSFGAGAYTVPEGGTQAVTVRLSADPERTVVIPLTATDQGTTSPADYSVPLSVTFNTGELLSKTVTFTAAQDPDDDDDESVLLGFSTSLPAGVSASGTVESTVTITDDDDPQVTVSFGAGAYTVAEGGMQAVTVTLSADPERTVDIPLVPTYEGGATAADYSGVPASLTFDAGVLLKTITFTATQDTEDDDDERVLLAFGSLPGRVSAGTTNQVIFDITDDDDPQVTVSFGQAAYTVAEGETVTVRVTLSADPERTVAIPITAMNQGGATPADYSGVPAILTFNTGDMLKTITFSATEDEEDEDGDSVKLTFGSLPGGVQAGTIDAATVSIGDDCGEVDIWCATTTFGATVHWAGRYDLYTGEVDNTEFSYNGADYRLLGVAVSQNGHDAGDDNHVVLPFGIPERTHLLIDFLNLSGTSDQLFDPPNNDWLDWTLHVSTVSDGKTLTATLRFSEARKLGGAWWRWSGGDIDDLRRAWTTSQLYRLRLMEDPRSGRTPQPLNPPLYLRVQGEVNTTQTWLRWLTPQTRNDRVPPVDGYTIQWKESSDSWDTATDVSETTRGPSRQRPVSHFLDGLTPGVEYNIRVIATDSAGDSEPSNEVTYTKPAEAQQSLSNTPAEGEPRIDGIPEVGQTLSVDTTAIADVDGLDDVVFQYQWLADDADIAGSTGSTYTVVSGDVGKAIRVRVAFTDDGGNEETLTSAPTVVTAAGLQLQSATVDGVTLTLTYSEVLDNGVTLGTTPFAVRRERVTPVALRRRGWRIQRAVASVLGGGGRGHGDGGLHRAQRPGLHPGHPRQEGGLLQRTGGHERHGIGPGGHS